MATLHLLCTRIHSANTSRRNLICIDSYLWLRSSIFWDISQRRVVIPYRRFGTTSRFYLQRSRIVPGLLLKMGRYVVPKRRYGITTVIYVTSQKSADNYIAAVACNYLRMTFFLYFADGASQYNPSNWSPSQNCSPDSHLQSVTTPDAVWHNLTSWRWGDHGSTVV